MLPIKGWRVYYADGSAFSSEDGTWAEAPPFGVQAVIYYHVDGRHVTNDGGDAAGEGIFVYQGDELGPPYEGVKMGLWLDRDGYYRVADLARLSTWPEAA